MVVARFFPQFRKWNGGPLIREAIGKVHSWEVVNDFAASLCGHMVAHTDALKTTDDEVDCGRCVCARLEGEAP